MSHTSNSTKTIVRQSSRGFFWHGVFIVLPVVILTTLGLVSLRQDRHLAEAEARQSAQHYADEISRAFRALISSWNDSPRLRLAFQIDKHGQLVMPPPAPTLPMPQGLRIETLTGEQQILWLAAKNSSADPHARAGAINACEKLLSGRLQPEFIAPTLYRLGILLAEDGKIAAAVRTMKNLEARYPEASTESGLSLLPLAQFKRFEWENPMDGSSAEDPLALATICSNLIHRPTFLTPFLLNRAHELTRDLPAAKIVATWQAQWDRDEVLRHLAAAALSSGRNEKRESLSLPRPRPPVPAYFWIDPPTDPAPRSTSTKHINSSGNPPDASMASSWLAARTDDGHGGYWIVCQAFGDANESRDESTEFWAELSRRVPGMPMWFAGTIKVAGRTLQLHSPGGDEELADPASNSPTAANVLATAQDLESGSDLLRVNVHLVNPEVLYARQKARSRWFGLLIAASAVVACAGFVSARRAFHRQQQLAEMKSNFVSSVSHELRAPIASVRLMAESLDRGTLKDPAKQRDYYRFIVQECRRLGALIENVLDFARIEQGRKEYDPQPTDVTALLQQTVKLLEPSANEKQVQLVTIIPDDPQLLEPAPVLDGQAIQQALVNLIDNAVKHSPSGSSVTVGINRDSKATGGETRGDTVLRLFVEDHGPGIPSRERERIFERFYRRGAELRRDTQGVGIGLSIVKHIVEAHGGRVIVEGAVGYGSRFTIELPQPATRPSPEADDSSARARGDSNSEHAKQNEHSSRAKDPNSQS